MCFAKSSPKCQSHESGREETLFHCQLGRLIPCQASDRRKRFDVLQRRDHELSELRFAARRTCSSNGLIVGFEAVKSHSFGFGYSAVGSGGSSLGVTLVQTKKV